MSAIIIGVIAIALLATLVYRERENARERHALLDRITAPEAATAAAFARAIGAEPVPTGPDTDAEDDLRYGRDITADLENDLIPFQGAT